MSTWESYSEAEERNSWWGQEPAFTVPSAESAGSDPESASTVGDYSGFQRSVEELLRQV